MVDGTFSVTLAATNSVGTGTTTLSLTIGGAGNLNTGNSPRVYPNPWRADKHAGHPITFDQMAAGSTVKIFTISGHLIRTLGPQASGLGTVLWDLTNDSGDAVASGIYIYLITDGQGNKTRGKVAIIK